MIKIRFYGVAYDKTGVRKWSPELDEGSTMADLLDLIACEFPDLRYMVFDDTVFRNYLALSINNVDILGLDGINTVLKDGDTVFVMPPIGGG